MPYRLCCLLILLLLHSFLACKKVVSVDLRNGSGQVVIEGELTDGTKSCRVQVSRSVSFASDNDFPAISGATVMVTDTNKNRTYQLVETDPGVYISSDISGLPFHTYHLSVTVDGTEYAAYSTMPQPVPLDSVTFALNTDFNNHKEINAIVNFRDPPGLGNYYRFIEYLDGSQLPDTFVFEDRLSDGRYIEQPLYNDSNYLHRGDTLQVKMYCVDKSDYLYFYSLIQATADGSTGYMSATPANPVTNLSNGALGYFSAHTTTQQEIIVY